MGARFDSAKKEVGDILKGIYSKLTPNQGKYGSLIFSAIIAIVFLCTATGRTVITCAGYLVFVYAIFFMASKLYEFAQEHSKAIPKPKAVPQAEPEIDDEVAIEDTETEETVHQITMDELQQDLDDEFEGDKE